ncbi:MAG: aldehyde dehydrogenase family protein [Actinomycetota bacterium]|nr:aldehyde dehydrogenase family protein [Actinomycetota bacterium]
MTTQGQKKKTPRRRTTKPKAPDKLVRFNPSTGEKFGEVPANSPGEIRDIVQQARKVQPEWEAIEPAGRARILRELRTAIYNRIDDIVETVHLETGKPRHEAFAHDVGPVIMDMNFYDRAVTKALKPQVRGRLAGPVYFGATSRVERRPFGVVGAISPWNYPFSLALAGALPALYAGNTVVLKPSEITPGVGEIIREVFEFLPSGVAQVVQGGGEVGAALVDAPCDKICFIGSPATGRKIAEAAAKHLTPVVMELGGMDPAIVLEDADLDIASSGVLWGSFVNAGQTCAASERAYVVESVADEFTERLLDKLSRLRQDADGEVGPMTMKRQYEIVERHVQDAIDKGAKVLAGGPEKGRQNENGSLWYAPTVLEEVNEEMELSQSETFGPVLPIIRVRDADEAVRKANEDGFSLTASVYSGDPERARQIGRDLRAGVVGVNEVGTAGFGASWAPWGGIGESGYGRIKGYEGLQEMTYPIHFSQTAGPMMKRIIWYPYTKEVKESMRAVIDVLAGPDAATKLRGIRTVARDLRQVMKDRL